MKPPCWRGVKPKRTRNGDKDTRTMVDERVDFFALGFQQVVRQAFGGN